MPNITLEQMVQQWLGAAHKFELNLNAAEVDLALTATETFKKSFDMERFNSKGSPAWRALKGKPRPTHISLLRETSALRDSISHTMKVTASGAEIKVYTNSKVFVREHRNKKGKCYAAIHNSGGSKVAANGSKASRILQRQFMPTDTGEFTKGDSSYMVDKYKNLHVKIFYGLPK